MPLDGEHVVAPLDYFDHPIVAVTRHDKALAQCVDCLMVEAVHLEIRTVEVESPGPLHQLDPVNSDVWGLVVAAVGRNMLIEGASVGDIDQLKAPADAEHRDPSLYCGPVEIEFERVALGLDHTDLRMLVGTETGRIDVCATRQQQTVEAFDDRAGVDIDRKVNRQTTRLDDTPRVVGDVEVERQTREAPLETLNLMAVLPSARQTDERMSQRPYLPVASALLRG